MDKRDDLIKKNKYSVYSYVDCYVYFILFPIYSNDY